MDHYTAIRCTGRWWVGCYIWYSEKGIGRGRSQPRILLAVPNITAHPSTASVPTSYYSMWHNNCLCIAKGCPSLTTAHPIDRVRYVVSAKRVLWSGDVQRLMSRLHGHRHPSSAVRSHAARSLRPARLRIRRMFRRRRGTHGRHLLR